MKELSNITYRLHIPINEDVEVEVIMLFITFPANEKIKARLDSVCKSLNITFEEWFDTAALKASEFDVLVKLETCKWFLYKM